MKEFLVAYLVAVTLNFALLWLEASPAGDTAVARPPIVRLYAGARVAVRRTADGAAQQVDLLIGDCLRASAVDDQEHLFPLTARLQCLEPLAGSLN